MKDQNLYSPSLKKSDLHRLGSFSQGPFCLVTWRWPVEEHRGGLSQGVADESGTCNSASLALHAGLPGALGSGWDPTHGPALPLTPSPPPPVLASIHLQVLP